MRTIILVALIGCTDAQITVGGGAEPEPGSYAGQYDKFLTRQQRLIEALFPPGGEPNFFTARSRAEDCVQALTAMRAMLAEPAAGQMELIVGHYRDVAEATAGNKIRVPKFQLESWAGDVRRGYAPGVASLAAHKPVPPPSSWEEAHAELEAKWSKGEDCGPAYERVLVALSGRPGSEPYVRHYRRIREDTQGFTTVRAGETRATVLEDLKILAAGVRSTGLK